MPAARRDPDYLLEDLAHVRSDVDAIRVNGQDESKQELQMVVVAEIAPRAPRAEQTLEPSRLGHQTESGNGFLGPLPHGGHYSRGHLPIRGLPCATRRAPRSGAVGEEPAKARGGVRKLAVHHPVPAIPQILLEIARVGHVVVLDPQCHALDEIW